MSLPEPGCYVCVRTGGLFGWIIRRATKSPYDHAAVVVDDGIVVEATPYDVRTSPLARYQGAQVCADTGEDLTPAQRAVITAKALSFIGAEYDWATIAVIGLGQLGLHWRILLRLTGGKRALICSQLVALCGQAAGLDWQCGKASPALVTPADLARRPGVAPLERP